LKAHGVAMISEADEGATGPASFMIADPDGTTNLCDRHVQRGSCRMGLLRVATAAGHPRTIRARIYRSRFQSEPHETR